MSSSFEHSSTPEDQEEHDFPAEALTQRVVRLLGLGQRSKSLLLGVPQVESALRSKKVRCVFLATDGSYGQKKGCVGLARGNRTPVYEMFDAATLGQWLGVEALTALGVKDRHLADGINRLLKGFEKPDADPSPSQEEE